jgi:hypothetical protein
MTNANNPRDSGDQRTPTEHDPPDEQPRPGHGAEQGKQWPHREPAEQALINEASRQPGGVQRSTMTEPDNHRSENPTG